MAIVKKGEKLMQTVKNFLETGKFNGVHMMTPGGFVDLTNEQVKEVLAGKEILAHPGCRGYDMGMSAEEILSQVVHNTVQYDEDGSAYFITA